MRRPQRVIHLRRLALALSAATLLLGGIAAAQRWRGYRGYRDPNDRGGVPTWEIDQDFKHDVFTFVRIQYDSYGGWGRGGGGWRTDWRDSDLNFSLRLQQLTSLKVNPEPIILRLTDEELFNYRLLGRFAVRKLEVGAEASFSRSRPLRSTAVARDLSLCLRLEGKTAGSGHRPRLSDAGRSDRDLGECPRRKRHEHALLQSHHRRQRSHHGIHLSQHRPWRRLGA